MLACSSAVTKLVLVLRPLILHHACDALMVCSLRIECPLPAVLYIRRHCRGHGCADTTYQPGEASAVQCSTVVLAVVTASGLVVAAMQVERVLAVHGVSYRIIQIQVTCSVFIFHLNKVDRSNSSRHLIPPSIYTHCVHPLTMLIFYNQSPILYDQPRHQNNSNLNRQPLKPLTTLPRSYPEVPGTYPQTPERRPLAPIESPPPAFLK